MSTVDGMSDLMLESIDRRTQQLFNQQSNDVHSRTDRLFAGLMIVQWLTGIVVAVFVSPLAWSGQHTSIHIHVWAALILGGLLTVLPVYLVRQYPGATFTRHTVGICQMLYSALLIHLTGGRIETHFHVFGSLAFLAFYRDWRVIVSASVVVALDHLLRGLFWPQSVYGVLTASPWRVVEHAFWVVFEDVFLITACMQTIKEMWSLARRQALVESTNDIVEAKVMLRTAELTRLESRNRQIANIVECSNDAIIGVDSQGLVLSWNRGAQRIYGYCATEMIGKSLAILLPSDKSSEPETLLEKLGRGETIENYESERIKKNGTSIYVSMTWSPVLDEDGKVTGTSIIARDITERREAERRVSEFYSTVSHELRTPLTSIRGALGLIESGVLEEAESKELVQVARTSSERLIRLINDILDLRKIEAGKMEMDRQPIKPDQLISAGIEAVKSMADESMMTLSQEPIAHDYVFADLDRIIQVLTNLLSNAIKFSAKGSKIRVRTKSTGSGCVRFSIIDQGAGIPGDQMHKLFGKFQQLDSSDTRQHCGTGLGLSICKAIVEDHGGSIGVDSTPGAGSTFWFELPICAPGKDQVQMPEIDLLKGNLARHAGMYTVLLVEDDPALTLVLCKQLELDGYRPVKAGTLAQAREFLRDSRPDAILLDLTLPDGNGLELVEELSFKRQTSTIPVIVITGKPRSCEGFSNATIIDWLTKPFDEGRLAGALQQALCIREPARVLVVDDDESTRIVLSKQLRSLHLHCLEAKDGMEAFQMIEQSMPDLIILDVAMPRIDGFKAVELLREAHMMSTPLIIYSGRDLCTSERESLRLGITRYLTKGRTSEEEFLNVVRDLLSQVSSNARSTPEKQDHWLKPNLVELAPSAIASDSSSGSCAVLPRSSKGGRNAES